MGYSMVHFWWLMDERWAQCRSWVIAITLSHRVCEITRWIINRTDASRASPSVFTPLLSSFPTGVRNGKDKKRQTLKKKKKFHYRSREKRWRNSFQIMRPSGGPWVLNSHEIYRKQDHKIPQTQESTNIMLLREWGKCTLSAELVLNMTGVIIQCEVIVLCCYGSTVV